ncbi:MAG: hypothetical protein Q9219_002873 [cf. Caloplaca sp. 3 TL-2023]
MEVKAHACELSTSHERVREPKPLNAISLHDGWIFSQVDDNDAKWLPVSRFPTNVHLDLLYNQVIPDPFIAKNERDVQWVGEKSWVYKKTFQLSSSSSHRKAVIVFEGLDTYATVFLNGKKILQAEDMFLPYRVDVTRDLRILSKNELEITFESTYLIVQGWDWGPALLTCGPWRPITLEFYTSRIADLYFKTQVDASLDWAELSVTCEIEGHAAVVKFEVLYEGKQIAYETVEVVDGAASTVFRTQKPELWYPARYGGQPLYDLKATIMVQGSVLDIASRRLGLRKVEVVQRKLQDAPGTTFFIRVNNIPIFCAGSNWIPADSFIPMINPSRYRTLIDSAIKGNQSMIRIWGGGIFEEQEFYDACDEMGQ